jgi:hypothetical protein
LLPNNQEKISQDFQNVHRHPQFGTEQKSPHSPQMSIKITNFSGVPNSEVLLFKFMKLLSISQFFLINRTENA